MSDSLEPSLPCLLPLLYVPANIIAFFIGLTTGNFFSGVLYAWYFMWLAPVGIVYSIILLLFRPWNTTREEAGFMLIVFAVMGAIDLALVMYAVNTGV